MSKQLSSHRFKEVYNQLGVNLDSLGCIMLDLKPLSNMYSIEWDGAASSLYYSSNPKRFWLDGWVIDKKAHITLLYGLMESGKKWEWYVKQVLSGWELKEVEIEKVDYFDSPWDSEAYYCIIAHIKTTPQLLEGHHRLSFLPHINTFPGYKPHVTICYIKKSSGEGYRDKMIEDFNKLWAGKKLEVKGLNFGGNK